MSDPTPQAEEPAASSWAGYEPPAPPPYEPDLDVVAYIERELDHDNVEHR